MIIILDDYCMLYWKEGKRRTINTKSGGRRSSWLCCKNDIENIPRDKGSEHLPSVEDDTADLETTFGMKARMKKNLGNSK